MNVDEIYEALGRWLRANCGQNGVATLLAVHAWAGQILGECINKAGQEGVLAKAAIEAYFVGLDSELEQGDKDRAVAMAEEILNGHTR